MKRIFFIGMLSLAGMLIGCNKDENVKESETTPQERHEFSATAGGFSHSSSRTKLENLDIFWQMGDHLGIFLKRSEATKYLLKEGAGSMKATFQADSTAPVAGGMELTRNIAVYPYAADLTAGETEAGYTVWNVEVPAEQRYANNSFAPGSFPMVAVSENASLAFKNVCGLLKPIPPGKGISQPTRTASCTSIRQLPTEAAVASVLSKTRKETISPLNNRSRR